MAGEKAVQDAKIMLLATEKAAMQTIAVIGLCTGKMSVKEISEKFKLSMSDVEGILEDYIGKI
ncbi:MAG: hypothetical protein LBQ79_12155 [Deltaproteobacteria bacterium]|jgi:hypothetical protein|nr:hypothetical protein [Deltaproteobacteria bacterium]